MTTDADPNESEGMKALRDSRDAAAQTATDAEARAVAAERKAAFAIGGFNLEDPVTKMFASQYQGDATPEAIAEAWTDAGLAPAGTAPTPPATEDEPPAANLSTQIDTAFTGSVPAATPASEDIMDSAYEAYHEARKTGKTAEDAQELVVAAISAGAIGEQAEGGARFNYNRTAFHERIG